MWFLQISDNKCVAYIYITMYIKMYEMHCTDYF
jgi:hypothetical protein